MVCTMQTAPWYVNAAEKVLKSGRQVTLVLDNKSILGVRISAIGTWANTQRRSAEYEVHPIAYYFSSVYLRHTR